MTTDDIDKIVHEFIIKNDAYPTPIGFMGFPKSVCTTVNEGSLIYFNLFSQIVFKSCLPWHTEFTTFSQRRFYKYRHNFV